MARKKRIFPIFVITLVIGIGLVAFSFVGSDLQLDLALLLTLDLIEQPVEFCPEALQFFRDGECVDIPPFDPEQPSFECPDGQTIEIRLDGIPVCIDECPAGETLITRPDGREICFSCPVGETIEIRPDGFAVCIGQCPAGTVDEMVEPSLFLQLIRDCNTNPEICEVQSTGECTEVICPENTQLVGSECIAITCPMGQVAVNNVCEDAMIEDPITQEPIACILIFDPVCGVNGQTFSNSCFAEASGFEILHMGECVTTDPIVLDCPEGTIQQEDVCVEDVPPEILPPTLEIATEGIDPLIFLILGIIIIIISIVGIILRRRR